jgi:HlyD family secretion protein
VWGGVWGAVWYYAYRDVAPSVPAQTIAETRIPVTPAPDNITAEGTIVPRRQATLAFKVGGNIAQVLVKESDVVQSGDVLAKLNDTDLRNQMMQADAALRVAQAELARASAGATSAERTAVQDALAAALAKYDNAVKSKASDMDLKQAAAGLSQAKSALAQLDPSPLTIAVAQAQVDQSQTALEIAKSAIDQASLTAPFAGTIAQVQAHVGDFVGPGVPVVTIGDLSKLSVESSDISDLDISRVKLGQRTIVTLDALPGKIFHGTVARISPMASESRGYKVFRVWIDLQEGVESGLRWGLDTKIELASSL